MTSDDLNAALHILQQRGVVFTISYEYAFVRIIPADNPSGTIVRSLYETIDAVIVQLAASFPE